MKVKTLSLLWETKKGEAAIIITEKANGTPRQAMISLEGGRCMTKKVATAAGLGAKGVKMMLFEKHKDK